MNSVSSPPARSPQRGRWHARLFIAPVLVVVLLGFNYVYWRQEQRALDIRRTQSFERAVDRTLTTLSDRMDAYEMVLRGVKGFFDASDRISHAEFRAYVEALQLRHTRPGLQGLALLERPHAFGAAAGMPRNESPWGTAPASGVVPADLPDGLPASWVDTQAPVTHHQPLTAGNLELLGLDAATLPATREAMLRARDTGQLALTGPIPDPADGSASLAMYLPLYQPGADADPASVADRRAQIHGWVAAPFRAADIVGGLKDQLDPDVAIVIMDGPSLVGGTLVYRSDSADAGRAAAGPAALSTAIRALNVGGRRWTVTLSASCAAKPLILTGTAIPTRSSSTSWLTTAKPSSRTLARMPRSVSSSVTVCCVIRGRGACAKYSSNSVAPKWASSTLPSDVQCAGKRLPMPNERCISRRLCERTR